MMKINNYKDFLDNDIKINDEVIYLKSIQTGSSSTRKIMFKGRVLNFKGKKVEIRREYTNEWNITNTVSDFVFPKDIVVLERR